MSRTQMASSSSSSSSSLTLFSTSPRTHYTQLLRRSSPSTLPLTRSLLPAKTTPSFSIQTTTRRTKALPLIFPKTPTWKLQSSSMAAEASTDKSVPNVQIFENEEELSVSLAKYTADLSDRFTKERGAFTVVVSGGSLIKYHRKLVESPYRDSIDWSRWHVFWVDERVVPKDHEDSNYKLAYDGFLSKIPIPPGQVYAINDALSAEGAADDYETCLKQLVKNKVVDVSAATGFPKFDLMLLGMGPDGHVASLFPGHPLVNESQRWVTFIKDSPKPPPERITFTFPVINSSANIAMVVAGSGKADVISKGLVNENSDALPFQRLSPEGAPTTWFMDKAAASKL